MRSIFLLVLAQISITAIGQRIDFRNDSLYINNYYVDSSTSKLTLDSLLNKEGKEKHKKGKYKAGTKELMEWTSYTYSSEGLRFNKYVDDTAHLSISIKLYKNSNPEIDQNNFPGKTFKGELFIDDNYMNDKRTIEQLQQLKNFSVQFQESSFASHTGITACRIVYRKRMITVYFDFQTNEVTSIHIL